MKRSIFALLVLFSISLLFSTTINAQKRGSKGDMMPGRLFEKLDLTDDQRSAIDDLRYEHRMKAIELQSQKHQNNLTMNKLLKESKIDEKEIMKLTEKNNSINNELSKMRTEKRIKIHNLLTPEQREQLGDFHCVGDGFGGGYGYKKFDDSPRRSFKGERQFRYRCF